MSRKGKNSPDMTTEPFDMFKFDPSRRFYLNHPVPVTPHSCGELPAEFRAPSPPAATAGALRQILNRPENELELLRPFLSSAIQLWFLVPERQGAWQPSLQVGYELMWVVVDKCEGHWPNATYHGTLQNLPVFINPETLRIGSTVTFQMSHVFENFILLLVPPSDTPFITIEEDTRAWLTVRYRNRKPAYPLTKKGIEQAGRDMYDSGQHGAAFSSSVDFPEDYGCRLDVNTLFQSALDAREQEIRDHGGTGGDPLLGR